MSDIDAVTLEADIADDATRDIGEAVSARHSIARKYVLRLRRKNPDATPADLIEMLERRYTTSIATAGTAIAVGGFAATIGIGLIPGGGAAKAVGHQAAKAATKQVAKVAAREAAKAAAKGMALNAARGGAQRAVGLLPAGEQQLQFEITAIFGLAIADLHGIEYDKDQAHALVYGLTNERVSSQQIAKMAADVAVVSPEGEAGAVRSNDDSQWATTLADALPGGAAQSLVRTMQTGHLDTVRDSMSGKQAAAVDYGVRAVAGGVQRFVFGREVVASARVAFPEPPAEFPAHLAVLVEEDDEDDEPNRALAALEGAGSRIADVAGSATSVFRSVDLDGDGVPDEARALTAVKDAGGAVAGAAGAVGGRVTGLFKRNRD